MLPGPVIKDATRNLETHPSAVGQDERSSIEDVRTLREAVLPAQGIHKRSLLTRVRCKDSSKTPVHPGDYARGKSSALSLLQPQDLLRRILPEREFYKLRSFALKGVPTDCGPPWPPHVIEAALEAGPHVSALTPENTALIWEEIDYQVKAGFAKVVPLSKLIAGGFPHHLKVSRVAIVPQANRRGRMILNLSAPVKLSGSRRSKPTSHPSVNETTAEADDQSAVQGLGRIMPSLLLFMYETPCTWEIRWQKIDLSDGFWRMIVQRGMEHNFVFQLPPKEGHDEKQYVVPSSLQMGWKNSPAYFCTVTEAAKTAILRLLALTWKRGLQEAHPHELKCVEQSFHQTDSPWIPIESVLTLSVVFVDDFMNAVAGAPDRETRDQEERWVSRAALHTIHAMFPPPAIAGHAGGKDSVSEKKLDKGDARFSPCKIMLGTQLTGNAGAGRLISLPEDKYLKYSQAIRTALDTPAHRVSRKHLEKIIGKLQYAGNTIPSLPGHLTPLYKALKGSGQFIGLGKSSETREVLAGFLPLLELAHKVPTHITEVVGPHWPHIYGTVDASGLGFGGVFLPCTRWIQPTVWRLEMPPALSARVSEGSLTMVDCEAVAWFVADCLIDELLARDHKRPKNHTISPSAGLTTILISDNSPTVHIAQRRASRAQSRTPERLLRLMSLRQRWLRKGPRDIRHHPGAENTMADIPSRSFAEYPAERTEEFFSHFANRFPLPPQLMSWRGVLPSVELSSLAISLLQGTPDLSHRKEIYLGNSGVVLPDILVPTLTSKTPSSPTSIWNEATCSWPLLLPCGTVSSTMGELLLDRQSKKRFGNAHRSCSTEDLKILGEAIQPRVTWTPDLGGT